MIAARLALLAALAVSASPQAWAQGESGNPVDERVGGSFNAAQSYQGPLDGSWTLVSDSGKALLAFQLVDKPGGQGPVEGVWRDLRRPATPGDIGLIDQIARSPAALTLTLSATPGQSTVMISLHADPAGMWSGELREGAETTQVKLRRN